MQHEESRRRPGECTCGYAAKDAADLQEHFLAMMNDDSKD